MINWDVIANVLIATGILGALGAALLSLLPLLMRMGSPIKETTLFPLRAAPICLAVVVAGLALKFFLG